jgi:phage terminase large subunit
LSVLKIPTAKVFEPLLAPVRYKGAFGGRGSGKSHFFGELLVETCQAERGTLAVCIREAQRTLAQSSKRLIESKIAGLGLGHGFKAYSDKIATPGDGVIIFRGMQVRAIATILTSFGIEEADRRELRADFQHLRRWRKSVEQAQSYTFKAMITIIVAGFVGAVWLGIKVMLGK